MRVCVVAEYYPRAHDPVSGIWAHRQALATRAAGADVRVLVLERPLPPVAAVRDALRGAPRPLLEALRETARAPRRALLDGIEVEYVRYLSPPRERAYATWHRYAQRPLERALDALAKRWPFDLVHAHYALPAGGAARPYAARRRLPLAVSVHGGDVLAPLLASPSASAAVGQVLRSAARVLCNSRATERRAAMLAGRSDNMEVVHLGTDIPSELAPPHHAPTIATLGHVVPRKRHADVLQALVLLRGEQPELRWSVIGDGPELPRLRAEADRLGLGRRVSFHGQLPPAAALDELARCTLMAMPSVDEAFGVAYVEALARGVPAVGCAGEGGPEEIARLGDGMLLVPPGSPEALASTLGAALSDRPRLARLGAAARQTARRHFAWDACGKATVAAYRAALEA